MREHWLNNIIDTCGHLPQIISHRDEIQATHVRLNHISSEGSHKRTVATSDHADNCLRGEMYALGLAKKINYGDKHALSYWRHGEVCTCSTNTDEMFEAVNSVDAVSSVSPDESPVKVYDTACGACSADNEEETETIPPSEYLHPSDVDKLLAVLDKSLSIARDSLLALARNPDPELRLLAAQNTNCPLDALWLLASDQSTEVRCSVAMNHTTSAAILQKLSEDMDPTVALYAKRIRRSRLRDDYFEWSDCDW